MNLSLYDAFVAAYQDWKTARAYQHLLKTNPAALSSSSGYGGMSSPAKNNDANLSAFEVDEFIYVSAVSISENMSSAPLIPEQLEVVDGEERCVKADPTSPIAQVLQHPNDDESLIELEWRAWLSMSLTGDGYWMTPTDKEIFWLDPSWVKDIKADEETGAVSEYHIKYKGNEAVYPKDEIVHFRWPSHKHSQFGFSPIKPAETSILWTYYGGKYVKNFFRNGAHTGGVISTDQPTPPEAEQEAARKSWNAAHQGVDQAHRVAFLGAGYQYKPTIPPLKDLIVKDLFALSRENKLAILGVPPVLAGILEHASYANARQQLEIFWRSKLIPRMRLFEAALNMQWVPRFGDNYRVRHDLSKIEALQKDQKALGEYATKVYQGQLVTRNEGREIIGFDAVDGGEEFYSAPQPMGMNAINLGGNDEGGGKASHSLLTKVAGDGDPRLVKWQAHYKTVTTAEGSFERTMDTFFRQQRDRVVAKLRDMTSGGHNSTALGLWLTKGDDDLPPGAADDIFDVIIEAELIVGATSPVVRRTIDSSGRQAIAKIGIDLSFNVNNPLVEGMFEQFAQRIVKVNATTRADIRSILKQGYEDGEGIEKLARRIREQYGDYLNGVGENVMSRSKKIAVTEMNGAVNGGARQGYKQAGVEKLEWLSAFLSTSRPEHTYADGQLADIDGSFDIGGEQLKYPGDPNGSAANIINCHCAVNPVVED